MIYPIIAEAGGPPSGNSPAAQGIDTLARLERARKAALVRAEANRRRADALEQEVLSLREKLQGERVSQALCRRQIEQLSAALDDATARKTRYMQALIDLVRAMGPARAIKVDTAGRIRPACAQEDAESGPLSPDEV